MSGAVTVAGKVTVSVWRGLYPVDLGRTPAHNGAGPAGAPVRCYTDPMSTDELLAEALRLTRVDRARVAEELLSSLEEPDDEVAAAWATELERRSREIAEGRVQPTSWPTARTEILKELEQRRAARTAS
ncbi:MAG: addiction module protein [Vicinamibacterales bacterium]